MYIFFLNRTLNSTTTIIGGMNEKEDRNEVLCRIYIMADGGLLHNPCVTLALCTPRPLNGISSFEVVYELIPQSSLPL